MDTPSSTSPLIPDFIVAGAPKCGTSSIYDWLNRHPRLVGSTPKEPFYFMDEDNPLMDPRRNYHRQGLEGWRELFDDGARQGGRLYFEATTHLIYQRTALEVLPGLATRPKFIFLLRDPFRRLRSSFEYTRKNLARLDAGLDFGGYVALLLEGRGAELERFVRTPESLYVLRRDLDYSNYWQYLREWHAAVGPERMHVVQFERLIRDPRSVMLGVCDFLNVDASCYSDDFDFAARNETIEVSYPAVHRLARRLSRALPAGSLKQLAKRAYLSAQRSQKRPPVAPPGPRLDQSRLAELLLAENRPLQEHFDVDLRLWEQ